MEVKDSNGRLSAHIDGVMNRWENDITWMSCDSLHAWFKTHSRFIAMVFSLIARRRVRATLT